MALELSFKKDDTSTPWGFRLTGGAEYDVPLTVIKVVENSIAERGGLQENDVIVRVNETCTAGLTHGQSHNALLAAGNDLVLAVKRGEVISPTTTEENEEVAKMQANVISEDVIQQAQDVKPKQITIENSNTKMASQDHKWSTFLLKPKNPKPKKVSIDDLTPQAPPYRVLIVKQKKRDPNECRKIPADEATINESIEIPQEESNLAKEEEETTPEAEIIAKDEFLLDVEDTISETMSLPPLEGDEIEQELVEESTDDINQEVKQEQELDVSIEEKLAEVQRQLQALVHLPITIQSTIDAVTQQLASIVNLKAKTQPENVSEAHSEPEADYTEHIVTDTESEHENEELVNEEATLEQEAQNVEIEEHEEIMEEIELSEEEIKERQLQQELYEKQQKKLQEEFRARRERDDGRPLKPIDRPIILPGGRRWSQPDDAVAAAVRHPKMSDEKIANTIETYSEVLVGKAKGINFLKYQPPPKNLDYLQRSDTYRLIHDMEPPVRGICSRTAKILAEQDYVQPHDTTV